MKKPKAVRGKKGKAAQETISENQDVIDDAVDVNASIDSMLDINEADIQSLSKESKPSKKRALSEISQDQILAFKSNQVTQSIHSG